VAPAAPPRPMWNASSCSSLPRARRTRCGRNRDTKRALFHWAVAQQQCIEMQIQQQQQQHHQMHYHVDYPAPQQQHGQTLRESGELREVTQHWAIATRSELRVVELNHKLETLGARCDTLVAENEALATIVRTRVEKRQKKRLAAVARAAEAPMQCTLRRPPVPTNVIDVLENADFAALVSTCRAAVSDSWACRRCTLPDVALGMGNGGTPTWRLLRTRAAGWGGASLVEKAMLHTLTATRVPWTRVQLASGRYVAAWVARPPRAIAWKSLTRCRCRLRLRHHLDRFLPGRLHRHV